jgi:hypothetical protein
LNPTGSGCEDFFKKDVTTLLRWVIVRIHDIGREIFMLGKPWDSARRARLDSLLVDFGDNFYALFRGVSTCRIIKLHVLIHLSRDTARFASPLNYIAHSFERSMIEFVRTVFARTNAAKTPMTEKRMLLEIIRRLVIAEEVAERQRVRWTKELHEEMLAAASFTSLVSAVAPREEEHHYSDEEDEIVAGVLEEESDVSSSKQTLALEYKRLRGFQGILSVGKVIPSTGYRDWHLSSIDALAPPYLTLCTVSRASRLLVIQ